MICKYIFTILFFYHCIFTLRRASVDAQVFKIFNEVQFAYFSFCCLHLRCHIQGLVVKSNVVQLFPYVLF